MAVRRSAPSSSVPQTPQIQVPRWDKDPVSSLRIHSVILDVAGRDVEIPAMSAADWLTVLMQPDLTLNELLDVVPDVETIMGEVELGIDEWSDVCLEMISTVSARPWWITMKLVGIAVNSWDNLGAAMLRRVDAEKVSLAAWLTIFLIVVIEALDPKDVTMTLARIEAPPPNVEREPEQTEMSVSDWLALGR